MKKQTLFSLVALAVLIAGAVPAQPKALKVLMIGNSFSICVQKEMPQIARAMGLELDLASLYIGGCSLERHWNNVVAATNADFRPYKYTRFVNGVEQPERAINIPEALAEAKWDVVTFQQASHYSWQPATYSPFAGDLVKFVKGKVPRAEIVVQETWSYTPWDKRYAKWGIDQHQMYAKLHRAYYDYAADHGYRVIPMGTAVQLFRERLPVVYAPNSFGGDPCGSAKFVQDAQGGWSPRGDVFHLSARGNYLQGLVWTAKLFGVDVTACPYRPDCVSAADAELMKKCAMAAVRGEQPSPKFGGQAIPPAVAAGMAKIRAAGVAGGEIVEVEYRPGSLRVGYVLRPSPESYIRCELGLCDPEKWNGRLYGCGNGGWAGKVGCPRGGRAAVSTDLGTSQYGINENPVPLEVMKDFGWRATHLMTVEAKKLVQLYYGRPAHHAYFSGASTGGGQGLAEAQRFPADYDGIVSEVPGNDRLPRATLLWRQEQLKKRHGKWFSAEEQRLVREAELAYFAKTDPEWARGKFIVDPRPTPEKLSGCWREIVRRAPQLADREALWRALFGPVVVKGRTLSAGQLIGIEFRPPWTFTIEKFIGPRSAKDLTEDELVLFADEPHQRFVAPDLSAFKARGGKLIMYAALEDQSVPALPVCDYYDQVVAKMGGLDATQAFFLHFLEPGRSHSPDRKHGGSMLGGFERGTLIEDWVEKGIRPQELVFNWIDGSGRRLAVKPYPDNTPTCR